MSDVNIWLKYFFSDAEVWCLIVSSPLDDLCIYIWMSVMIISEPRWQRHSNVLVIIVSPHRLWPSCIGCDQAWSKIGTDQQILSKPLEKLSEGKKCICLSTTWMWACPRWSEARSSGRRSTWANQLEPCKLKWSC